MKRKSKVLALLLAVSMTLSVVAPAEMFGVSDVAEAAYKADTAYDASETNLKVQPTVYSYNGYKMHALTKSTTWLADEAKIGTGYSLFSYGEIAKGDKLVIEFKEPINSKEFEYVTLAIKHVPGNEFSVYNATDNFLSDVKKKIVFTSHDLENFSFPTESFADENGYVQAIVLECTKQSEKGQLFVDEFSVSASPYKKDTWYDATEEYLKVQLGTNYKGLTVIPLAGVNTFWSGEAKVDSDDGYALISSNPDGTDVAKGDIMILEFQSAIKASEFKYINISTVTSSETAATIEFYNVNDIKDGKLGKVKQTGIAGSWGFVASSLVAKNFADEEGYVDAIAIRIASDKAATFSVGGFSLTDEASTATGYVEPPKPYQLNVMYDADPSYLKTQVLAEYKGMKVAPFTERSTFWAKEAKVDSDTGLGLIAHRADGNKLQKGDVMILEFNAPISAKKFEVLNLTLATSTVGGAELEVYSVNEVKDGKLGPVRQRVKAGFWEFETNNIALSSLANGEGDVEALVLKIVSDEADTFTVGGFSLATLDSIIEPGANQILDNKLQIQESEDAYDFYIEFNCAGKPVETVDLTELKEHVLLNGVPVSEINKDQEYVTLEWQQMGKYYLHLNVSKAYDGEGAIFNTNKLLVGNCIELKEGMKIPNGDVLTKTYNVHVYLTDNVTDVVSDSEYAPVAVNKITSSINENNDLMISVSFNNHITGSTVFYACNPDSFNSKDLAALNDSTTTYYDPVIAKAFILGGYKSSILDNLEINGNSVAEWLAMDQLAGSSAFNTAIMVHYGMEGNRVMTIFVSGLSSIGKVLQESYKNGEMSITLNEGLKFTTGKALQSTFHYQYKEDVWNLQKEGEFTVYYDGVKVEDKATIDCNKAPNLANISIIGKENCEIKEEISGTTATYEIVENDETLLSFTVNGTEPAVVTFARETSITGYVVAAVALAAVAVVCGIMIRRRKNAKKIKG